MKFLADIEVEQGADTTFVDNAKALFGTSGDLEIYHDGSNSYIADVGTGDLTIRSSNDLRLQAASTEAYLTCNENGSVQIYYNNTEKFATSSTGINITGGWVTDGVSVATANIEHTDNSKALFGDGNDMQIYHDGSNSYVRDVGTGRLWIDSNGEGVSIISDGSGATPMAHFYKDAAVELYYNNIKRIETTSVGATITGDLKVSGAYYDTSNSPGTADQILSSTVTGTTWIDPSAIVAEAATLVVIACKNTSGATITKGTPVYQTGTVGATATIEIAPADALISANKLPAIGLLQTDLNNNGFGKVVITGELTSFTTSPIDGVTPTTGDKIFVKSGGGLTLTKPTGEGNGIQNMGLVGKVSSGNSGSITVSSIMRTNDVPNLPEGRIWVGDGNTLVSDTIYIDEPNLRLGIGTTSPSAKLEITTLRESGIRLSSSDISAAVDELLSGIDFYSPDTGFEGIKASIKVNYADTAANSYMTFSTGANAEAMRIDASGDSTFAGNVNTGAAKYLRFNPAASGSDAAILFGNTSGTGGGLTFKRNSDSAAILTLNGDKNATFAGSVTVASGDMTLQGTGRIRGVDTVSVGTDAANKNYVDNAVAGIPVGDITGVTAGAGLSGGGNSGTVTLNLDLGELATGGTLIATDYLIAENGGVDNRQLISSIPLSIFNNNAGWTSNTGDITGVTAGTGLSGGGTSGTVTLTNSGVTQIIAGTNVTISPSGGTGNVTINASGGGGSGTIGGTIAITELAVGDATDSIDGSSKLTFTYVSGGLGYDKLRIGDGSTGSGQVLLDINTLGTGSSRGRLTLSDAGTLRGFLGITGGDEEVTLLSNDDLSLGCGSGVADIIKLNTNSSERLRINYSGDVGIGNTDPASKLSVAGGIQMANDTETSTTNSDKAGTLRYREVNTGGVPGTRFSYTDMYMRTDTGTYEWVNIVTNKW